MRLLLIVMGMVALAPAAVAVAANRADLDAWRARLRKAEASIQAGEGVLAERASRSLLAEMIDRIAGGEAENEWLALAMEHLALARAVQRDEEGARYWWWSAQALWPDIAKLDLTEFGDAGAMLAEAGAPDAPGDAALDGAGSGGPPVVADERPLPPTVTEAAGAEPASSPSEAPAPSPSEAPAPGAAPSAPDPSRAVRITQGITPPRLVKRVEPVFPHAKASAGAAAEIVLRTVIDETGRVIDPVVMRAGAPGGYLASALLAASQWQYEPARRDGKPQAVYLLLRMRYTMGARP